jgi:hypothetical protein
MHILHGKHYTPYGVKIHKGSKKNYVFIYKEKKITA